jgi:four helix bundle protein
VQRFTDLKVWQKSHRLVLDVYRATADFPMEERFGITSQLRRAVVSIATNIAEGSKRRTPFDYARFLNIAEGSAAEAEYLMMVSRDLGYMPAQTAAPLQAETGEVARMLDGLRTKVETCGIEDETRARR